MTSINYWYICYTEFFNLFFSKSIKDSSGQGAWHGEEETVQIGRGVVLLGGYRGDASNWTMLQRREAP
jgi:hypothetical protein